MVPMSSPSAASPSRPAPSLAAVFAARSSPHATSPTPTPTPTPSSATPNEPNHLPNSDHISNHDSTPVRTFSPHPSLLTAAHNLLSGLSHLAELAAVPDSWSHDAAIFAPGDPDPIEALAQFAGLPIGDIHDAIYDRFFAPIAFLQHANVDLDAIPAFMRYASPHPTDYFGWVPVARYGPLLVLAHFLPSCEDYASFPRELSIRITVRADAYMELRSQALAFVRGQSTLERLAQEGSVFTPLAAFAPAAIDEERTAGFPDADIDQRVKLRWLCTTGIAAEADITEMRSALDRPQLDTSFFPAKWEACLAHINGPDPILPLGLIAPVEDAFAAVPDQFRHQYHAVGVYSTGKRLFVALPAHHGPAIEDQLRSRLTLPLIRLVSDAQECITTQDLLERDVGLTSPDEDDAPNQDLADLEYYISPREFTGFDPYQRGIEPKTLLKYFLFMAARRQAADIHIEAHKGRCRIRLSVNGAGITLCQTPLTYLRRFSALIKTEIGANLGGHDPCEGHFTYAVANRRIDVRVVMVPISIDGAEREYKSVLRLFDKSLGVKTLAHLDLPQDDVATIQRGYMRPQGLLLVTGPTGSGKSTTLYSIINGLNSERNYIYTAEDPVEQRIEGVTQIEINPDAALDEPMSFPDVLKRLLRMAPTHILVGEMRDAPTVQMAINASLTGHFVMATLHTNDSIGAIPRLVNLGVPHELIAQTLSMVLAQRLVRNLCTCKQPQILTPEHRLQFQNAGLSIPSSVTRIYRPSGCALCNHTGYRGRSAVVEIFEPTPSIRIAITERASLHEIHRIARDAGFVPLMAKGLQRVLDGKSSLEEVHYRCTT